MDKLIDRVMSGETPLQAVSKLDERPVSKMTSLERFPYYTSFPFAWYRVAFAEQLAAGEVRPIRYLGRDLIAWREADGTPHVMDAYCPHLGAHLGVGGQVEGCELVCPFHWWRFDGEGRNTLIPYDGGRNESATIKSYPTVERNGIVLFWYHPTGEPPLWEVPELDLCSDPAYTDYDRYTWHIRIPWQEFAENGPDFIHLRTVHGAVEIPELERLTYDGYTTSLRSKVNFDTPRGPQSGRIDTDGWGPGFAVARFSGIIDAFFVGCSTPIDFDVLEVTHSYRVGKLGTTPELLDRTRRVGDALIRDLVKQVEEDIVIFEHKISQPQPKLSAADGPIPQFRKWAQQFYLPGDPRATNR
ncbi:MAG: Rieske 2Fe-2S domain-containing protein [Myxococcota bacterium]|nr:Rieske 2Fe-2S domain-containing protein [Myxococcota bacterium]